MQLIQSIRKAGYVNIKDGKVQSAHEVHVCEQGGATEPVRLVTGHGRDSEDAGAPETPTLPKDHSPLRQSDED